MAHIQILYKVETVERVLYGLGLFTQITVLIIVLVISVNY